MDEKNCASAVKNPRVVPNDCGCAAARSPSAADRPGEAVPGGSSQVSFLPGGWGALRCRVSAGYFRFFRKGRLRRAAALFRKGIRRHGRSFCAEACGGPAGGVALPGDSLRRMRTPLRKRRALLLTGMEVRTEAPCGCRRCGPHCLRSGSSGFARTMLFAASGRRAGASGHRPQGPDDRFAAGRRARSGALSGVCGGGFPSGEIRRKKVS